MAIVAASVLLLLTGGSLTLGVLPGGEDLGNILVGAGIALFATYVTEAWKRRRLAKDVTVLLHHELALLVARCCVDFEAPWKAILAAPIQMGRFRASKFVPEQPIVYKANADKVALLDTMAISALMGFYFRLGVIRRDIETLISGLGDGKLTPDDTQVIASRFAAAVAPGMEALKALGALVRDHLSIEADALALIEVGASTREKGTLRERLQRLISEEGLSARR